MRSIFLVTVLNLVATFASAQPATLQAAGYQPGWRLAIDGTTASFSQGLQLQAPPPLVTGLAQTPMVNGSSRTYQVQTTSGVLTATFTQQMCTDAVSAIVHPDTVSVRFANNTYAGCGGDPLSLLQGRSWLVEDIASRGVMGDALVTLQFGRDGEFSGRSACKPYEGRYGFVDGALHLTAAPSNRPAAPTAAAQKICPPALRRQDAAFFEVLGSITRWDFTADGALALGTLDGRRIVARRP